MIKGRIHSRESRIVWTRENDAYYPRDKYRSILDYCGGRCDQDGELLRIRNVQPEDKGTYRLGRIAGPWSYCYVSTV